MEIETEFSIPLEELAEIIPAKKPREGIVDLLDHESKKADVTVKQIIVNFISHQKLNTTVTTVKFNQL